MVKLFFENSKQNKLCGILSDVNKEVVVIMCHGANSSKDSKTFLMLEKELNAKSLSTFRFDFYGHGGSEGKFEDITVSEGVDDVLNAVKLMVGKGFTRIGLVGSSFSGMVCLLAAPLVKELFVLALKSPVCDYYDKLVWQGIYDFKKWKRQGFVSKYLNTKKLNYSFFEDVMTLKGEGYLAAGKLRVPTIIVHGDNDKTAPLTYSVKTSKLIKNCELEIIKDCGHSYFEPEHFDKMIRLIGEFIVVSAYRN
ncbi:MAG: alpha/beta hydrolase [Nanoarchaeota archaeon]|nr:alpha/beta hydrolase [Nanoarchaeota archaeon]